MNGCRHLSYNPNSVYIVLKRDCRKRQAIDTIRDKLPIENRHKKRSCLHKQLLDYLIVGVNGFEPSTPCSQSRCANRTALHPVTRIDLPADRGAKVRFYFKKQNIHPRFFINGGMIHT